MALPFSQAWNYHQCLAQQFLQSSQTPVKKQYHTWQLLETVQEDEDKTENGRGQDDCCTLRPFISLLI
jgi:hypothetical protein